MPPFIYENISSFYISNYKSVKYTLADPDWQIYSAICLAIFVISLFVMIVSYCRFLRIFNLFDPNSKRIEGYHVIMDRQDTDWDNHPTWKDGIHDIWEQLTITENIYEILIDNYSIPEEISDVILKDYCGFNKIQMNPKPKIDQFKRKPLYLFIVLLILNAFVLFAGYCGVTFMVQYDKVNVKYRIVFECDCLRTDHYDVGMCRIENYTNISRFNEIYDTDGRVSSNNRIIYNDFYDDIWIPYLKEYEPALVDKYSHDLYLPTCLNSTGALYLSQNGVGDCHYTDYICNDCCGVWYKLLSCASAVMTSVILLPLVFIVFYVLMIQDTNKNLGTHDINKNPIGLAFLRIIEEMNRDNDLELIELQ
eukprot:84228_1